MLSTKQKKLFKELLETVAISGQEYQMARALKKHYEPFCDEIIYDNLGSICAHKKSKNPNAPKVMVLGHMDEVGLHVGNVTNDGCIHLNPYKLSIWNQVLMTQRVYIQTREGKLINGVIDTIPPHMLTPELREKPMDPAKMFIDVGARSKEEVEKMGINLFDPVVIRGDFEELNGGKRLLAKAFDNRYGCIAGVELLEAVSKLDLDIDLYVGATVQEEVGGMGARALTEIIKPDFAIVLDCSPASDMGGGENLNGVLGKGVLIRYADRTMIAFPELLRYQEEICDKNGVKYQYFMSPGGTDAGTIHVLNGGILTLTHCICARNIHTCSSILDVEDYEGALKALIAMVKDLNREKIEKFKEARR